MQQRVRAIFIGSGSIELIERHRSNRWYSVFPGGGVEAGEMPHQALIREVLEETGLLIAAVWEFVGQNDMMAYLVMMTQRLVELHRFLKPTGSLYLH